MSVGYQRIISGRIALPFQAVDCSDRLYTSCVPGTSLSYLLPETSHDRMTSRRRRRPTPAGRRGRRRRGGPSPSSPAAAGRRRPVDDTGESGNPVESIGPSGGGGVRTTSDASSGQMPSDSPVSRPTTPSTNSSRSVLQALHRCRPWRRRSWPLIGALCSSRRRPGPAAGTRRRSRLRRCPSTRFSSRQSSGSSVAATALSKPGRDGRLLTRRRHHGCGGARGDGGGRSGRVPLVAAT